MKTKNLIEAGVSFGAAVVVMGALFKLEHMAFASTFLWIGLITEAAIFTVYGFQYLFNKIPNDSPTISSPTGTIHNTDKLTESVDRLDSTIKKIFNQ